MRTHLYTDVSNWSEPYSNGVFPYDYLGSLGAQPAEPGAGAPPGQAAETPAAITAPEVTIYGQCDFTAGKYVEQMQQMLVSAGTLAAPAALAEKGVFGEATCNAWNAKYGHYPTAAELAATLGPNVSCATLLVPACAAQAEAGSAGAFTPGKIMLYGAGLIGLLVLARAIGKKK